MPRCVAFLRAVNVDGRTVKMDALRAAFEALPLTNVETFIASGNVVFDSRARDAAALERRIEGQLLAAFGFEIDTFVRTLDEVALVVAHPTLQTTAATQVVGFLRSAPAPQALLAVAAMSTDTDRLVVHGRELLWLSSNRQSDSVFSNAAFERALKTRSTFRGVGTLRKLVAKFATA
ncbi:MAG: DUF1697 domain-containing protein [Burkholderiales bacterium]